jgi:DNA replication protein DnaC
VPLRCAHCTECSTYYAVTRLPPSRAPASSRTTGLLLANASGERTPTIFATYSESPPLIIDDLGMRKLPASAAEDLLEILMRRYERASTIFTSKRSLEDWPKLLGDRPAVAADLDRLMHDGHLYRDPWEKLPLARE